MKYRLVLIVITFWILDLSQGASALAQSSQSIGNVTAVQRQVEVVHSGVSGVSVATVGASVFFKDAYETKSQAKLKLLFEDDSILSLGENTKLQITENIYNPNQDQRSTIIEMSNGTVRALIGKIFGGPGSKFEIHTLTAVAAARGTYFIVWTFKEEKPKLTISLSDILFDFGKATLHADVQDQLAQQVKVLAAYPDYQIVVKGHTDNIGTDVFNQQLSEARAESVRSALIAIGISPDKIKAVGFGKSRPLVENDTPEGRQKNRRVEIAVLNPTQPPEEAPPPAKGAKPPMPGQPTPATKEEMDLTGVVNIGESGKVVVRSVDPNVEHSVELEPRQYVVVEKGKPPIQATSISQEQLNELLSSTELKDQVIEGLPRGTEAPGSDVSGIKVTGFPSKQTTKGKTEEEALFHTMPPIPQQPVLNNTPISVGVSFP